MSMDICKDCGTFVDTDDYPECYYLEDEDGRVIEEGVCRCSNCNEGLSKFPQVSEGAALALDPRNVSLPDLSDLPQYPSAVPPEIQRLLRQDSLTGKESVHHQSLENFTNELSEKPQKNLKPTTDENWEKTSQSLGYTGPKTLLCVSSNHGNIDFTQSFSGLDWAEAFVNMVKKKPEIATDVSTMHGWFANAIMRGFDEHARRKMPIEEARVIAAQCWCDPETEHLIMEPALAEAFAKRLVA